jgi:S1-C subfamily serine protease
MIRSLPLAALLACPIGAQRPTADFLQVQQVLQGAADRAAASVVRIETYGGVRRELSAEEGADALGRAGSSKMKKELLAQLFERADPVEVGELWRQKGLEAKDTPLEAEDLRQLGDAVLDRLLRKHQLGPYQPKSGAEREEDLRKIGQGAGFVQAQGASTGLVLSADGWILASRFALSFDPTTVLVTLPDGRTFTATRHGEDTSRGLALLKIDATDLAVPEFVDPQSVRVGQWAFVLGRTFAPRGRPSVHAGIVSATERLFGRAIQVDAWTSPANYGGAVVDSRGRVLGVAVPLSPSGRDAGADWYDSGIGFAVTLADIGDVLDRLRGGEVLHRAWFGVLLAPEHLGPGAVVTDVSVDSPASSLSLLRGDVLVEFAGERVRNAFHAQILIGRHLAGDPVEVVWMRDGARHEATVQLGAVPFREREAVTRSDEVFEKPWEGDPPPGADEQGRRAP